MQYTFEWDAEKTRANKENHRVSFDEAATAFADPLSCTIPDPDHSPSEERAVLLGMSNEAIDFGSSQQGSRPSARSGCMKKARRKRSSVEMRPEYDFSGAVRGKYAGKIARTATVVVLEPDVAQVFKTSESVNTALRALVAIARPKKGKRAG